MIDFNNWGELQKQYFIFKSGNKLFISYINQNKKIKIIEDEDIEYNLILFKKSNIEHISDSDLIYLKTYYLTNIKSLKYKEIKKLYKDIIIVNYKQYLTIMKNIYNYIS